MANYLIFACLCVCVFVCPCRAVPLKENASGGSATGSTCGSRPASQMSHAASSGYGSARSHNRATAASGETPAAPAEAASPAGRHAALFRSLRIPQRAEAIYGIAGIIGGTETLPLRSVAEVPVPAPRFHTLNNKKKPAYQNIPLPLKTQLHPVSVEDAQFFQVGAIYLFPCLFIHRC